MTFTLIATLALSSLPQAADLNEVLVRTSDVFDTQLGPRSAFQFTEVETAADGGWCAIAEFGPSTSMVYGSSIIGQRAGAGDGPVELLREGGPVSGVIQRGMRSPSMANGKLAYLAIIGPTSQSLNTAWLDDQIIFSRGDAVGTDGDVWRGFSEIQVTVAGTVWVSGQIGPAFSGQFYDALVEWPSGEVHIRTGDMLTGVPQAVTSVQEFSVSPDGAHYAAVVRVETSNRDAIVVDGDLHEFEPGYFAFARRAVTPRVAEVVGAAATWRIFRNVDINNAGDLAFYSLNFGMSEAMISVRNGLPLSGPIDGLVCSGIDENGGVLLGTQNVNTQAFIDNVPVMDLNAPVDVDRDGIADADWELSPFGFTQLEAPNAEGLTLFREEIFQPSTSTTERAILRARNSRIDTLSCLGQPNSTGRPGGMIASGDPRAASNDLALQAFQLPQDAMGYFLVSETSDLIVLPGGRQGNLCLGGDVGRLVDQFFVTGPEGTGQAALDLTAIPQPSGFGQVTAGQTWYMQAWHRDSIDGAATSNFTSAVSVTFD